MAKDLSKIAKQKKIKYFLISFVDLFGVLRSKLVPAQAIGEMQKNGAGFAGFATYLDMTPAYPDMFSTCLSHTLHALCMIIAHRLVLFLRHPHGSCLFGLELRSQILSFSLVSIMCLASVPFSGCYAFS